jgi:hypothetical protein
LAVTRSLDGDIRKFRQGAYFPPGPCHDSHRDSEPLGLHSRERCRPSKAPTSRDQVANYVADDDEVWWSHEELPTHIDGDFPALPFADA